jgi:hypothetical protein
MFGPDARSSWESPRGGRKSRQGSDPLPAADIRDILTGCKLYGVRSIVGIRYSGTEPPTSIPRGAKTIDKSVPVLDFSSSRYSVISLQSAEVTVPKNDSKSVAYEIRTKSAKSGGLETNGPRERISGHAGGVEVPMFLREGPRLGGFCARSKVGLAEGEGIRTAGTVAPRHVGEGSATVSGLDVLAQLRSARPTNPET